MRRRRLRKRGGSPTISIAITLLSLHHAPLTAVEAGLSIGGVTSTDSCYSALQSNKRPDENVVDRAEYVSFINDLSDDAFTAFQYNEELDKWGYFPVTEFDQLPANVRGEFYRQACGGPLIICDNAFLYTDGTQSGEGPSPQQEVYLYQVCTGVEEAIDDAVSKQATHMSTPWESLDDGPDGQPTPTSSQSDQSQVSSTRPAGFPAYMPSETSQHSTSSNDFVPSPPSKQPARYGEVMGPIQTEGLKIILFGIDTVQNEPGWSVGHAIYINDFFNSEWNCKSVAVSISSTI